MQPRIVITYILVVVSALLLTACGSETETPAYPGVDEQIDLPEITEAYPYPDNELYLPVTGSDPAYPDPEVVGQTEPNPSIVDPYPSVEDSENSRKVLDFIDLSPAASDKNLVSGTVYIESGGLIFDESDPVQVEVNIIGNLPTPCHKLRVTVAEPTADGRIDVDAYTITDPEKMCIQVLVPFETSIPLNDLADGDYTVFVNGEQTASFELP